jgi:protease PrsW
VHRNRSSAWEKIRVRRRHSCRSAHHDLRPPPCLARGARRRTALFIAEERTLVATQNPNLVPSAILLGASIVPLAFVAFVYGRRLPYRVPGPAVAASAFLGGVIGTIVAATLEFDVLRALGGLPMLGVGLIEETSKLLVPLALLIPLRRYRTPADGLLIGVACGAGFAALETMGYAFTTLIKSGGDITDTVDILLLRGFLSPAGHMAWTGIAAAALYAAAATPGRRQILRFVGAFVVAVVLHTLWDSQSSLLGTAVVAVRAWGCSRGRHTEPRAPRCRPTRRGRRRHA